MSGLVIHSVLVLSDNYVHLVHDPISGQTACIDPAVDTPVIEAAREKGWTITHILITHPHYDHTDGVAGVVKEFDAQVYGSRHDFGQIPSCDHGVLQGDLIDIGEVTCKVLEVPGHTAHHVAYYFESAGALFPGDTLFSLGCGRLFGGTAQQMWDSLKKLRALPDNTLVYCAHEYTNANADFALSVDPDNADLQARADEVVKLREAGQPTVPSTMASEILCNPFLRCDIPAFQQALGMAGRDPDKIFAELRRQKDHF